MCNRKASNYKNVNIHLARSDFRVYILLYLSDFGNSKMQFITLILCSLLPMHSQGVAGAKTIKRNKGVQMEPHKHGQEARECRTETEKAHKEDTTTSNSRFHFATWGDTQAKRNINKHRSMGVSTHPWPLLPG